MKIKICTKCKLFKPLEDFAKNNQQVSGYACHCKDCMNKYRKIHSIQIAKSKHNWYKKNFKRLQQRKKEYREINKEQISNYRKNYYQKNKKIEFKNANIYRQNQYNTNISYKLLHIARTRIRLALRKLDKSLSTIFLIGCEIDYLMYHLQEQFKPGMSWDNYGEWHVDHIRPCASFDLSKPSEQRKCFHYMNLQPLWAGENRKKGSKC